MARKFNDRLARVLTLAGVTAGGLYSLFIVLAPATAFSLLTSLDIRWLLFVVGNIGIVVIALLLYSRLYFPRVKRLCLTVNRAIWAIGILLTSFPFALRQIDVDADSKTLLVETSATTSGIDSGVVFITMVVGSHFMTKMYYDVISAERKLGQEL